MPWWLVLAAFLLWPKVAFPSGEGLAVAWWVHVLGGAHLVCAQTGVLAETMAHCWGGERARDFLDKDPGSLSLSLIPVIFFYVL